MTTDDLEKELIPHHFDPTLTRERDELQKRDENITWPKVEHAIRFKTEEMMEKIQKICSENKKSLNNVTLEELNK